MKIISQYNTHAYFRKVTKKWTTQRVFQPFTHAINHYNCTQYRGIPTPAMGAPYPYSKLGDGFFVLNRSPFHNLDTWLLDVNARSPNEKNSEGRKWNTTPSMGSFLTIDKTAEQTITDLVCAYHGAAAAIFGDQYNFHALFHKYTFGAKSARARAHVTQNPTVVSRCFAHIVPTRNVPFLHLLCLIQPVHPAIHEEFWSSTYNPHWNPSLAELQDWPKTLKKHQFQLCAVL